MAEKKKEEMEKAVVEIRDVSIALDRYSDIFSDFDPRPFSKRELSEDFLKELERRILTDVRGNFEIRFYLPKALRDEKAEDIIIKRLKAYFRATMREIEKQDEGIKKSGITFIITGIIALAIYAFLVPDLTMGAVPTMLEILLVPIGWFFMWEGLGKILLGERDRLKKKIDFYKKLSKANFIFLSEAENVAGAMQEKAEAAKK
ncbi:hypothetical protein DRN67_03105 [Candidatus Micrarchaeota archaeon]|nr:MAG: hypothetical protein DRN67_03105 [Candidatus Micrarchaeota archaeon]